MKTKKYLTQLLDGSGHLNPAPVKKFEKAPDYYGYIKFDDKFLKLSACGQSLKLANHWSLTITSMRSPLSLRTIIMRYHNN